MNAIVDFFKSQPQDCTSVSSGKNYRIAKSDIKNLMNLFSKDFYKPSIIRLLPSKKKGQIWTVKKEYIDFQGNLQVTQHPPMVLICSQTEDKEGEQVLRVQPISPFIEMAGKDDIICERQNITGFPFLVETWNEQPVMAEILEHYIGSCDFDDFIELGAQDSSIEDIESFRRIEIDNAKFLNHSLLVYLNELERSEHFVFSADLFFNGSKKSVHVAKGQPDFSLLLQHESYSMAAKSGNSSEEENLIDFDEPNLPFKIQIRHNNDGYVLTLHTSESVKLSLDSTDQSFKAYCVENRVIFSELPSGLYRIEGNSLDDIITIRLK